MDPKEFIERLKSAEGYRDQIAHIEVIPAREAAYADPERPVPEALSSALREAQAVEQLWSHQATAVDAARRGESVCVVSGTASGKTLCYNLPILETMLDDPTATALYIFPTKALAQDQLRHLHKLHEHCPEIPLAYTYDGDLSRNAREKVRREARLILSNPDMLHVNLLPSHTRWDRFLTNLRYVVIDEIHAIRGLFGSHCAHVFRRLTRLCTRYRGANADSRPLQFICCSATVANPREHAEALTGQDMTVVDDDGAPRGARYFVFWNPPVTDPVRQRRRSAHVEAVELIAELVRADFRGIAFTKWWGATELVSRYTRELLAKSGLEDKVASYRGGYLASHRRDIERRLFDGDLAAVVSTNALELGINIGGLDAAVIVGFPGTISATWQQAGRAGRTDADSLAILVAYDTSINQYLMNYPAYFFGKDSEKVLIAPRNRHILTGQLACASYELPLSADELRSFVAGKVLGHIPTRDIEALIARQHTELQAQVAPGVEAPKESEDEELLLQDRQPIEPLLEDDAREAIEEAAALLDLMEEEGLVRYAGGRWYYSQTGKPAYRVHLRAITTENYTIVDLTNPEEEVIIGQIDQISAYPTLHPEAIYFHKGEQYFVDNLDLEKKRAEVRRVDVDYYTSPLGGRGVSIIHSVDERAEFPGGEVWFGDVTCHFNTGAYQKIRLWDRQVFDQRPVDLPPQKLETTAYWVNPTEETTSRILAHGRDPHYARYGLGQALMVVTALFASCDPLDVRASECVPPECDRWGTNRYSSFIFDNSQGALGFVELAFARIEDLLDTTLSLIAECPCEDGCPFCVGFYLRPFIRHDPENSEGLIPDKEGALMILHDVLGLKVYEPKPAEERKGTWRRRVEPQEHVQPGGVAEEPQERSKELPEHIRGQILRRLGKGGKL